MEEKSKNRKVIIGIIGIVLIAVICVVMCFVYGGDKEEASGVEKTITIHVESARDSYVFDEEYNTDIEYLGDFLVEEHLIGFETSEYVRYITSVQGYNADDKEQSWWNVSVNGESAMTGVDSIAVEDGAVYSFELKTGW